MTKPKSKLTLIFVASVLCSTAEGATDCDCAHMPWKPKRCVKECRAKILSNATELDLVEYLGLEPPLAQKLVELRDDAPFEDLTDVKKNVRRNEYQKIIQGLERLTEEEVQFLLLPDERRPRERPDPDARVQDGDILTVVKGRLLVAPELGAARISVDVRNGVVVLSGVVFTAEERQRAEEIAAEVEGVERIENLLSLERQ